MKTQSNRSKLSVLVALVFLATVLAASPAQAIIIICKSGMFGFTTGQTARVNVVNYGNPDDRPVTVSVKFLNKDGNVLGEFRLTDPLLAGKAAAFDLNRDDLVSAAPGRHEIRVEVTVGDLDEKRADALRNRVKTTIEIINNETGKTEVFWGDPDD